ncbi:MAG TPA: PVC-type heme-binding CxxCH protein [Gemmata sp.]|nr:PVC-type heme-binding CxxCH protein [Gemmata sp.]
MSRYLLPLLLALLPSVAFGQANATIPDPDPELERKTFIVAPGFEVNLYAADPLLAKPIQMNFDPQGRLWVASSEVYPQIKPGEVANDKIIILEDTKGVGKADKTTIFADGLLIPTGVEPGDGGAYVANSTELVHLSASKPGQKADKKRILLSGFGTEDTHHIIHTFRWGPDCHLYFNQSVYIHSHIETPTGVKRLNAGGIWRFNPDRTELDVFCRGFWNTWGHAFDKYGQSFITDGANGEGITHGVPGAYYPASTGPHVSRLLHGLNPGSPKHCGLEIISGRHFPDDWQGDCITNDFRGHRVCRFKLQDDGSTYASREMTEVIKSNHPAFRPIDVKMGPDGALYIADWYNPIIQHGEVDFRDPRRDKTHGRIWRVTAKGRPLVEKPKLVDATIPDLLEQLKSPEQWTRQQAKRVLKERGKEKVLPEVFAWLQKIGPRLTPEVSQYLFEAMWVCESFDVFADLPADADMKNPYVVLLLSVMAHNDPKFRAMACRLFGRCGIKKEHKEMLLEEAGRNAHPQVRLEAIRALADQKSARAADFALHALDQPMDRVVDYALWLTVRELEPYWMPEFQSGKLTFGGDAKKIAFALSAVGNRESIKPVVALIDSGKVPNENVHGLWLLLAQIGGPEELGKVLAHITAKDNISATQRIELIQAIEEAARIRKIGPPRDLPPFQSLLNFDATVSRSTLRLIGLWKIQSQRKVVEMTASTPSKVSSDLRMAGLEGLASFGDAEAKKLIVGLCSTNQPAETRRLAIIALSSLDATAASSQAAEFLISAKPEPALLDLYTAFLSRKASVPALAKALAGKKLNPEVAKLGLQAIRASTLTVPELVDALTRAGDLGAAQKPPTDAEVKALAADTLKMGSAARGETIFRRKELQCLACHGIGGAGGQVGPDLTSIGASAQVDYLVDSILLPSKAIKEGFNAFRIVTVEDKVFLGIKVREANGSLVLRTADDKEITIPLKDIAERHDAKSLMPEGLTDTLTREELTDLVRFLAELGKIGPYAPSKSRLVRRWQVIEPTGPNLEMFRRNRVSTAAEPDAAFTWSSVYTRVGGELPLSELPKFSVWSGTADQTVLRFQLDVTTAGKVKLKFDSTSGLSLYLGATPVEAKDETVLDLKAGIQTVTAIIDRSVRRQDVRVELEDVVDSPARVAVVGGK